MFICWFFKPSNNSNKAFLGILKPIKFNFNLKTRHTSKKALSSKNIYSTIKDEFLGMVCTWICLEILLMCIELKWKLEMCICSEWCPGSIKETSNHKRNVDHVHLYDRPCWFYSCNIHGHFLCIVKLQKLYINVSIFFNFRAKTERNVISIIYCIH